MTKLPVPAASPPPTLSTVTALLLAGGRGSRMGGVDKGLQAFRGQPLAWHALQRLAQQQGGPLGGVLLNANRHAQAYEALGEAEQGIGRVRVLPDTVQDYSGPLAGMAVGLAHCHTPLLLTVPCDSPLFPLDLALRLLDAMQATQADIAVAQAPEPDASGQPVLRSQPVFCLLKTSLAPSLVKYMAEGGRKISAWTERHAVAAVAFDAPHDAPDAFSNANTLDELRQLEGR